MKVTSPPAASLGDQLDLALKNEDEQTAWEIVEKMEADQAAQSLQDQQLMVELMEQELEMLDAMEQLEQLENLEKEEKELEQALLLSKQPLEKLDQVDYSLCTARPPASPCTSLSKPPVIVVAQPPAQCYSAPMLFQIHMWWDQVWNSYIKLDQHGNMDHITCTAYTSPCPGPDNLETLPMPTLDMELPWEPEPMALPDQKKNPEEVDILHQKTLILGETDHLTPGESQEGQTGGSAAMEDTSGNQSTSGKDDTSRKEDTPMKDDTSGKEGASKQTAASGTEPLEDENAESTSKKKETNVLTSIIDPVAIPDYYVLPRCFQIPFALNSPEAIPIVLDRFVPVRPEELSDGYDRPAALDKVVPITPDQQKSSRGRGRGGRGRGGRGRGRGAGKVESKDDEEETSKETEKVEKKRCRRGKRNKDEEQEEHVEEKKAPKKAKNKGKESTEVKKKHEKVEGVSYSEGQDPKMEGDVSKPKRKAKSNKEKVTDEASKGKKSPKKAEKGGKGKDSSKKAVNDSKENASSSQDRAPGSRKRKEAGKDNKDEDETKTALKAKLSRKSAAYHRAKVAALKDGKSAEEAKNLGREVPWKGFSSFSLKSLSVRIEGRAIINLLK